FFGGYFGSEWSFARFRVPDYRCIACFGSTTNTVAVMCADGSYYKAKFDSVFGDEETLTSSGEVFDPDPTKRCFWFEEKPCQRRLFSGDRRIVADSWVKILKSRDVGICQDSESRAYLVLGGLNILLKTATSITDNNGSENPGALSPAAKRQRTRPTVDGPAAKRRASQPTTAENDDSRRTTASSTTMNADESKPTSIDERPQPEESHSGVFDELQRFLSLPGLEESPPAMRSEGGESPAAADSSTPRKSELLLDEDTLSWAAENFDDLVGYFE
ncbi:WD repeat domain phosphoinositide-interacting protein 3, partial [Perkinsus olseni]